MYEHNITYYPLTYYVESRDTATEDASPLAGPLLPVDPDPRSILTNEDYLRDIETLGQNGWELVSVVPLLRGCYHEGDSYGYSLTAGYYCFWKRYIDQT